LDVNLHMLLTTNKPIFSFCTRWILFVYASAI
jgi:hypothetical protein